MRIHRSLWTACGTRGVDNIGQLIRVYSDRKILNRLFCDCFPIGIQQNESSRMIWQTSKQALLCQQKRSLTIREHKSQTFLWVTGIKWDIGPSSFENAQQGHNQLKRAF